MRVQQLYEDDEFSRMCPGQKDFVSVRIDGKKVQKQKRLLLNNLKEMHSAYKSKYGPEIGFSKFCNLRPKWCVTVGAAGTHSVCVCTYHQNVKLMLAAIEIPDNYKDLMKIIVCNIESKDCMLQRCDQCPSTQLLEDYLDSYFIWADFGPDDHIEFKLDIYK